MLGGVFMSFDYPELYYRVYPKVIAAVNEELEENLLREEISQEQLNRMVDKIYVKMVHECPEIHEDPYERRSRRVRGEQEIFYGRSRIIRDLITILLISELLRRNRSFYPL